MPFFFVGLLLVTSCVHGANTNEDTVSPEQAVRITSAWKIDYRVSGGFAGIRRRLQITSDGQLLAIDEKTRRNIERRLTQNELSEIEDMLAAIPATKDHHPRRPDIGRCADCLQHSVTVIFDGKKVGMGTLRRDVSKTPYGKLVRTLSPLLTNTLRRSIPHN